MKKPALVVLAAGMGSRYGGLKQIDPVGPEGEIILDYSIYDAVKNGFDKVVFVIRHDIEKEFRASVGGRWEKRIDVDYAFQDLNDLPAPYKLPEGRTKPWGTGHAILSAEKFLSQPFASINADDFYGRDAFRLVARAFAENQDPVQHFMVGFILRNTLSENGFVSRGICECNSAGLLDSVTERTKIYPLPGGKAYFEEDGIKTELTGEEVVSMNFWGFMPSLFDFLGAQFEEFLAKRGTEMKSEFYAPSAVATLLERKQATVKVMKSSDSWFGVTYREDRENVRKSIAQLVADGVYPAGLEL